MDYKHCWYREFCDNRNDLSKCNPACLKFCEILELFKKSNLPEYRWNPQVLRRTEDSDEFDRLVQIKQNIYDWVKEGNNLYLYSQIYGNGKTSWAIKLLQSYFERVWKGNAFRCRGLFINFAEFFDRERQLINNRDEEFISIRNNLLNCDFVVWDDISSVTLSEYSRALFLNFIDARMSSHKTNVFTGNADCVRLEEVLGPRLVSRIWGLSEIIELSHEGWRNK